MLDLIIIASIGFSASLGTTIGINKIMKNRNPTEYKFVHEENIIEELKQEGISKKNKKCIVCNKNIRKDNIGAVIQKNEEDYFVCKDNDCLIIGNIAIDRVS